MAWIGHILSEYATFWARGIMDCIHHPVPALLDCLEMTVLLYVALLSHEAGHYLVAKAFHCSITEVQIGDCYRLLRWTDRTGTQFEVAFPPISGHVRLQSLKHTGKHENKAGTLERQPAWKRMLINLAGPTGNIALALVLTPLRGQNVTLRLLVWMLRCSAVLNLLPFRGSDGAHVLINLMGVFRRRRRHEASAL